MGSGEIGVPAFRTLLKHREFEILCLVTSPDSRGSRGKGKIISPMKKVAETEAVEISQIQALDDSFLTFLKKKRPDIILVMDYGIKIPKEILDFPSLGCVNVHGSLLPFGRGASCIQSTILSGKKEGGISLIKMNKELDAGEIIEIFPILLKGRETGETLRNQLSLLSAEILPKSLLRWKQERRSIPQDSDFVTFAPKLSREAGAIDWTMSASNLERMVRAYHSWPGNFCGFLWKGKVLRTKIFPFLKESKEEGNPGEILMLDSERILVSCGTGSVWINSFQLEGKKKMPISEFICGFSPKVGDCFLNGKSVVD